MSLIALGLWFVDLGAGGGASVQSGPVIASPDFRPAPGGFVASSRKSEKMLKQEISLRRGQKYRVRFDITELSGPAFVVVDFFWTNYDNDEQEFHLKLSAADTPLRVDRILDAGNPPAEAYLRIFYYDPVTLGVANIRVSRYSPLRGLIQQALLVVGTLGVVSCFVLFLRSRWPSIPKRGAEILQQASRFDPTWSTAALLIFILGVAVMVRNLALNYPLVFGDEGIYAILAKYAGAQHVLSGDEIVPAIPNTLYLWFYRSVFLLGSNYATGARLLNVVFLVTGLLVLYSLAALFMSRGKATLVALAVGAGPMTVYTACFMPETMYMFAFFCLAFIFVRNVYSKPVYAGCLSGIVLGAASLVKPHALMLIPAVLLALVILKLSVGEWCRWRICGAAVGALLGSAILSIALLDYLLLGKVGFSLGSTYTMLVTKSTAALSIASMLNVVKGHVALVLSVYALPVLVVLIALCPGSVVMRTVAERVRLKALLILTVSVGCLLLITTTQFTVSNTGASIYEKANRIHARYYFFVLPLLIVAFFAVYERLNWTKWVKAVFIIGCLVMCAFSAYSILVLDRRYFMYFPDFPDAFWFNMNKNIGRSVVLVGTCGTLLIYACYAWRRISATLFGVVFALVSVVGSYFISEYVITQPPTQTARAAALFENIIGAERLDAGTVFATFPGDDDVYLLLFEMPAAYDLKIIKNQEPITADMLSDNQQWVVVTSPRQVLFPYSETFALGRYRLYLREPERGEMSVDAQRSSGSSPVLTGTCQGAQLIGFQQSWGVWSARDPAEIVLAQEVKGRFSMRLVGYALGKERPQTLKVQIGDSVKSIMLQSAAQAFELDFDLRTPARTIVLQGVTPKSPLELGLSADGRQLAVAVAQLDCTTR